MAKQTITLTFSNNLDLLQGQETVHNAILDGEIFEELSLTSIDNTMQVIVSNDDDRELVLTRLSEAAEDELILEAFETHVA